MRREPDSAIRIDKWLWAARFFKTRGDATEAVTAGHVRVNGERVKPARGVHLGDTVEVRVGWRAWTVIVRGLAGKRGPASDAAALYGETEESAALRAQRATDLRHSRPPGADLGGRPTKQDRRRIEALRRGARRGS